MARRPLGTLGPAPCFGQHNAEVLTELAGCTPAEIEELAEAQVIVTTPIK
jgi:hypothetical protein